MLSTNLNATNLSFPFQSPFLCQHKVDPAPYYSEEYIREEVEDEGENVGEEEGDEACLSYFYVDLEKPLALKYSTSTGSHTEEIPTLNCTAINCK